MRTQAVLLLFILSAAAARNVEKRVYGGQPCPDNQRRYHVVVETLDGGYCGGSLIAQDWVLTAAHCGDGGELVVTLNVHGPGAAPRQQRVDVDHQFVHHDDHHCHDIMLLQLAPPAQGAAPLHVINLPPQQLAACVAARPADGTGISVGGFGLTERKWSPTFRHPLRRVKGGPIADQLQCATMNMVAPCQLQGSPPIQTQQNSLCFQRPPQARKVDTCPGDSGTAVEHNNHIFGVYILGFAEVCVGPAVASDVCFYRAWINRLTHL